VTGSCKGSIEIYKVDEEIKGNITWQTRK